MLIRQVRLVPVGQAAHHGGSDQTPLDLRVTDGVVAEIAPTLVVRPEERVLSADGRWAIPGLWDAHVHLTQWALDRLRVDLSGSGSATEVLGRVATHLATLDAAGRPDDLLVGAGFRLGGWDRPPTVAELDAVTGAHPVVLVSGDLHNGWLSTAALRLLGLADRRGVITENDWFAVLQRLSTMPAARSGLAASYARCVRDAAAVGVVGVVDMEFSAGHLDWPARFAAGVDQLRVRTAVYPDGLDEVITAGLRTGDPLEPTGQVRMGPLKIIADGSVNTQTAYCCEPYAQTLAAQTLAAQTATEQGCGVLNVAAGDLVRLLRRAHEHGLRAAVHAIGDAAVAHAVEAFAGSGARGSIEHAQLVRFGDLDRMAALGLVASVQPAHLLDDRPVSQRYWPDRTDRCFAFASMLKAGVRLALGSDAPVSPLDPWLAMAAAVERIPTDGGGPWNPAEALTPAQALAASTDGRTTLAVGAPADLVLLDRDPLADPARLASTPVAATMVAGRITHSMGLDR